MTDAPRRIQLRRTPGWRMPANTVSCARPSLLGNPWPASRFGQAQAVAMHEIWLREPNAQALGYAGDLAGRLNALRDAVLQELPKLRGKNLGCWCRIPRPGQDDCCHAATLLRLANADHPPLPTRRTAVRELGVLALATSIARARYRGPYRANRVRQSVEERERALAAAEAKRERRRARNRMLLSIGAVMPATPRTRSGA